MARHSLDVASPNPVTRELPIPVSPEEHSERLRDVAKLEQRGGGAHSGGWAQHET